MTTGAAAARDSNLVESHGDPSWCRASTVIACSVGYWLFRSQPSPDSDSRNFSGPRFRELALSPSVTMSGDLSPVLSLLHPPPVGTVLPLIPLMAT